MKKKVGAEFTRSPEMRAADIIGATALLALGWPILAHTAVKIRRVDHMPWLFTQQRIGRGFVPFDMYKFQTMLPGTPETPSQGALDPRATELGKKLRYSHLDEGPQLVNILWGNMSFTGFRPPIAQEVEMTRDVLNNRERPQWERAIHILKPGVLSPYHLKLEEGNHSGHDLGELALSTIEFANTITLDMYRGMIEEAFGHTVEGVNRLRGPGVGAPAEDLSLE